MTIEMQRKESVWVYRTNPDNPRVIDRKRNKHGAKWELFRRCADEQIAKDSLFQLEKDANRDK